MNAGASGLVCVNVIDALTDNAFNVAFKTSRRKWYICL